MTKLLQTTVCHPLILETVIWCILPHDPNIIFLRKNKIHNFLGCKKSDFKHILVVSCARTKNWPKIQNLACSALRRQSEARDVIDLVTVTETKAIVKKLRWQPRKCPRLPGSVLQNIRGCLASSYRTSEAAWLRPAKCPRLPGSVLWNVRGCLAPSSKMSEAAWLRPTKCPRLPGSVFKNVRGFLAPSSILNFPISMATVWNFKIPTSRGCSPLPCQVSLRSVEKPRRS